MDLLLQADSAGTAYSAQAKSTRLLWQRHSTQRT